MKNPFKKKLQEGLQSQESVFTNSPPIDGGNLFAKHEELKARDNLIKTTWSNFKSGLKSKISTLLGIDSQTNTYSFWYLLNFVADYFSNLVDFEFDDQKVQQAVNLAIRLGVIYGTSCIVKDGEKVGGMYVNEVTTDIFGNFTYINYSAGNNALMSAENREDANYKHPKHLSVESAINDNIIVFSPFTHRVGGLVTWRPFLLTLERLFKMVYLNSWGYAKSYKYNVRDVNVVDEELKLFASLDNPFLLTIGDEENLINNKFSALEFNTAGRGIELMAFINQYLGMFYDLIGRRYNVDKKTERNVSAEVDASQENFKILQRELVNNIKHLLKQTKQLTGVNYVINNEDNKEEMEDENNSNNEWVQSRNEPEHNDK